MPDTREYLGSPVSDWGDLPVKDIAVWHRGHPGLALVDGDLLIVPDSLLRHVYASVLELTDKEVGSVGIDWGALDTQLARRIYYRLGKGVMERADA